LRSRSRKEPHHFDRVGAVTRCGSGSDGSKLKFFNIADPYHFDAAPGKSFDAVPAPTLLDSKAKFLKQLQFKHMLKLSSFDSAIYIAEIMNCNVLQTVTF
jgi:hypothetical protein